VNNKKHLSLIIIILFAAVLFSSCKRSTPIPVDKAVLSMALAPKDKAAIKKIHEFHEKGKVDCVVCHHKNDNDDRNKKCVDCHDSADENVLKLCIACHTEKNK